MSRPHHVIYVPGILDDIYHAQSLLLKSWRLYGLHAHCHVMPWAGEEEYASKLQGLLTLIDELADQNYRISLVGASAGASAVINAYVGRPTAIGSLAYICGKINFPETVSERTYSRNPAFKTSLYQLQTNLVKLTPRDKAKMISFYSPADKTVPYEHTCIKGVREHRLPAMSHGRAILYTLSFGAPSVARSLKLPFNKL